MRKKSKTFIITNKKKDKIIQKLFPLAFVDEFWLSSDNGQEIMFTKRPILYGMGAFDAKGGTWSHVPRGTIQKVIGRKLKFEDDAVYVQVK